MKRRRPIDLATVRDARRQLERLAEEDSAQFSPKQLRRLKTALRKDERQPMARKDPAEKKTRMLVVRCLPELLKRLDIYAAARSTPGEERYSRGDAARDLIEAGLARSEQKQSRK